MASFKSILSDIGTGLKKFFGVAVEAAQVAEPFVDAVFPGAAALYNTVVGEVAKAETAAIAAGAQNGTGAQKLALVVAAVEGQFNQFAAANGWATPTIATIENYVNAAVATLNAIPTANS